MKKIKIAVCADLDELCLYYQYIIEKEADMEFAGSAHNSVECIELVKNTRPDILLLDIQLESTEAGIELIPVINAENPSTKIIMLTVHEQDDYIFNAITDGAEDFLLKTYPDEQILSTIREVFNGEHHINRNVVNKLLKVWGDYRRQQKSLLYIINNFTQLSHTEIEILHDIYDGLSYKEIAQKRYIEEISVRTHVSRILKKFQCSNMRSLIRTLQELKVFDLLK